MHEENENNWPTDARVQDVVASLSHVKLKQTVKVLRALAMVAQTMGNKTLAAELHVLLQESARQGGFPAPLHAKPESSSIDACLVATQRVRDLFGEGAVERMASLEDDPYFDNLISPPRTG